MVAECNVYASLFDCLQASPVQVNFKPWEEDLMRALILSDINSPLNLVTALPFLLEGDAINYYHSLT